MLERFGGYTLQTLLAEDPKLFQMVRMVDMEREVNGAERDQNPSPDSEFD